MTSRDFCYWLQGFFELSGEGMMSDEQCKTLRKHLAMVFKHEIDPSFGPPEKQKDLNRIHNHDNAQIKC